MSGLKVITNPRGTIISSKNGQATLSWNPNFASQRNEQFKKKQMFVDSEVLRRCSLRVPFRTGMLEKSGILGTVVGSGEVNYIAPYAAHQYYDIQDKTAYEGKSNAECIRYQCSIVNDFFDSVCGKGTSEKLFGGKCNLGKSMEAFAIITTEARNDDKINDITNKYMPTPNRAERRNQKYKGKKRNSSKIHPYTPNERPV